MLLYSTLQFNTGKIDIAYFSGNNRSICNRPVHIPTHAVLTLDSISVSSNLVTGSPLLLVNVLLDQTCLFISDKQHQIINLRNGLSVC